MTTEPSSPEPAPEPASTTAPPILGLLRPVTALMIAASILMMGNGLLGMLVPLRADAEHFTRLEIGILGSCYYAGLMAGCWLCPAIIGRVGHIRAFVAFTASATINPLLHALFPIPEVWWVLRALNGLCFAGLFMGIESWLSGASTPETRGRILGLYTVINLTVVTLGIQMVGLMEPKSFQLFSLVAILFTLAAVPVALTPNAPPQTPRSTRLRLGWLISVSPVAVLGCFFTGLANSGFWTLAPLYAQGADLTTAQTALFVTTAVLGGAASQWPVGQLSDRFGRRPLLGLFGALASLAGLLLYTFAKGRAGELYVLAAFYGICAFPVYPLCVAHANDLVHRKRAVEVSSGLLMTFSIGAVIGPLLASLAMRNAGHGALFLHSAVAHALIVVVTLVRIQLRPSLPTTRTEDFVVLPRTTPAVFDLDPRGDGPEPDAPATNQNKVQYPG
jgi:MFS family permease